MLATATPSPTATSVATPECTDLVENGDFEDGLAGWEFDGEVKLRYGDLGDGRYAAMLLGRNSVTAQLTQKITIPGDSKSIHLVYWWRSVSSEPVTATRPYDMLSADTLWSGLHVTLETISNLSGRDDWLPSGYYILDATGPLEIAFHGNTNPRDPTEIYLDFVSLYSCSGAPAPYPSPDVQPASGAHNTVFSAGIAGLEPAESVSAWVLDPNRLRIDLRSANANDQGSAQLQFEIDEARLAGEYGFGAIGHDSLLPTSSSFEVTATEFDGVSQGSTGFR